MPFKFLVVQFQQEAMLDSLCDENTELRNALRISPTITSAESIARQPERHEKE